MYYYQIHIYLKTSNYNVQTTKMTSLSDLSISFNISTSSESENEVRGGIQFDTARTDFRKTRLPLKTSLASSLSRQTTNNSIKYFKKLKEKKNVYGSESQLKNKYSTNTPYSLKSKTKRSLPDSKLKYSKKKPYRNTIGSNSAALNKEFAHFLESSSDSDFPDLTFFKFVSKNKEINTSSSSMESKKSNSYLNTINKKQQTFNNSKENDKHFEPSTSLNSIDFSQDNIDSINFQANNNSQPNLDELNLSDCSLSDILFVRKDDSNRNSQLYSTSNNNSFLRMKSISPKTLPLNNSLGINDEPKLFQTEQNVIINVPDLIRDDTVDNLNKIVDEIDNHGQELILDNEHSKINEPESLSGEVEPNDYERRSNSFKSTEENISLKSHCIHCKNCSCSLKNGTINTSHSYFETKNKQNKSKRSPKKPLKNTSGVLQIKKSIRTKKNRNNSFNHETEDIGLEYDANKDNYLVKLPNGAMVPAFLSTLKPKYVKKLCACGITPSEVPSSWSESFHDILHASIYKLRFNGNLLNIDSINFNQDDLIYSVFIFYVNQYSDENIKKSIKNVYEFVNLEYGISEISSQLFEHPTYLAILPNRKIIGYLEVESIQKAYTLTHDEQFSEITVPVKFGVSKIWVLIKYCNQNVYRNLLETFCKRENLQKTELAFSLDGCKGVQFIQEYTGNENILVYDRRKF